MNWRAGRAGGELTGSRAADGYTVTLRIGEGKKLINFSGVTRYFTKLVYN